MKLKKITLMSLFLLGGIFTGLKAQTQTISFETAEGYSLGAANNQNGWILYSMGGAFTSANVVNTIASAGSNSVYVPVQSTSGDYGGLKKNISSLITGNDMEVSMDFYLTNLTSSYLFGLNTDTSTALDPNQMVGYIVIDPSGSVMVVVDPANNYGIYPTPAVNVVASQWYTLKIVVKKSIDIIEFYLNGSLLTSSPLGLNKNINAVELLMSDSGSGFYADNIKVTKFNSGNLATSENTKSGEEIKIYPNPTTDRLMVNTNQPIEKIQIIDSNGRLVKALENLKQGSIDVSDLASGNYLVKVITKNTEFVKKIIKK